VTARPRSFAAMTADFCFELLEGVRTMPGGDRCELLAVGIAALYFIKTARRIARPGDYGSAGENVVDERARLSAIKQAGARFGFYTNSHGSTKVQKCVSLKNRTNVLSIQGHPGTLGDAGLQFNNWKTAAGDSGPVVFRYRSVPGMDFFSLRFF